MTRVVVWMVAMASVQGAALYCGLHIVLNATPSLATGLYWRVARPAIIAPGTVLEFSPPDAMVPYLDGTAVGAHIMKQVIGVAGDTVCWQPEAMSVNRISLAARLPDRALNPALVGCRILGPDELVMIGIHPRSLDSRDIGPVDRRRILHRLIPLWTWRAAS